MNTNQITLKETIVNMFLESFDTLDNIMKFLNVSKEDTKVIRASIFRDFMDECK